MTTLLEIVKKLPPQLVASRPRLQLTIAWAHILLQRTGADRAALKRFEAAVDVADLRQRPAQTCGPRRTSYERSPRYSPTEPRT